MYTIFFVESVDRCVGVWDNIFWVTDTCTKSMRVIVRKWYIDKMVFTLIQWKDGLSYSTFSEMQCRCWLVNVMRNSLTSFCRPMSLGSHNKQPSWYDWKHLLALPPFVGKFWVLSQALRGIKNGMNFYILDIGMRPHFLCKYILAKPSFTSGRMMKQGR